MEIHPIWHDYPQLNDHLLKVKEVIHSHIRIKDNRIRAILTDALSSGGKLLRPAYALLCSQIGPEYDQEKSIALAAALETMHIATLVHDDVIDNADTRRGQTTLHTVHDNKFAIYAGDYLFSVCFSILSKYSSSLSHVAYNSRSMEKILAGELDQLHSRFQPPQSVKSYLSRIAGKTAQLFALACYVGAVESHADKRDARRAWNMGQYIGMAFQIIDDILDYQGDNKTLGKPVMMDVQQGVYTLPLIYTTLDYPEEVAAILVKDRPLSDQTVNELTMLINKANGIDKSLSLAKRYTSKALKQLEKLPDGAYKDDLRQITTQLLKRTT